MQTRGFSFDLMTRKCHLRPAGFVTIFVHLEPSDFVTFGIKNRACGGTWGGKMLSATLLYSLETEPTLFARCQFFGLVATFNIDKINLCDT